MYKLLETCYSGIDMNVWSKLLILALLATVIPLWALAVVTVLIPVKE